MLSSMSFEKTNSTMTSWSSPLAAWSPRHANPTPAGLASASRSDGMGSIATYGSATSWNHSSANMYGDASSVKLETRITALST